MGGAKPSRKEAKGEAAQKRQDELRKELDYDQHYLSIDELEARYSTDRSKGLSPAQVAKNQKEFGKNELTPPHTLHPFLKFLLQFANFFAMLLVGGGVLCFIAYGIDQSDSSNLYLGVVLLSVVTITALFSYYQEAASEKIMEGFKNMIPKSTTVIREGKPVVLHDPSEITIGDLVELGGGDQVPADVRLILSNDVKVDNSSLTGESEPQERVADPHPHPNAGGKVVAALEAHNLAFYTTNVSAGSGKGFVIGIGDQTAMGKIAGLVTGTEAEATPISKEIARFILLISGIAITLGVVFLIASIVSGNGAVSSIVFAIGIIVANVPEGLLATVTVALALTAKRMFSKNVLVKALQAVETLGSTSVIASDKTGTLTQNRMTVQHCWVDGAIRRVPTARNAPQLAALLKKGAQQGEQLVDAESPSWKALKRVAVLCNNAKFVGIDLSEANEPDFNILTANATSDASEQGLLKAVQLFRDAEEERAANPKSFEVPFNSTNKYQLSIHDPEEGGPPLLVFKGAPERVIGFCSRILDRGVDRPMTEADRDAFNRAYETLGGFGERVLGFAYQSLDGERNGFAPAKGFQPSKNLVFAGLFSLIDPAKDGVPEAVEKCKSARIRVFMVTGDHPITAVAIAKQVGIIDQEKWDAGDATVVKGDDIREWMSQLDAATEAEEQVLSEVRKAGCRNWEEYAEKNASKPGFGDLKTKYTDARAGKEAGRKHAHAKFDEALAHEQLVFARVSPAHKLVIVENCQRNAEVVAVTGDGVNDAPALKKGDIGVAMGIAGKDVSKEAADMILMDDNFASIVSGVEEGRLIFDNLKKSIAYTLTSNIPEIAPFLTYITLQLPLPLSTVLILCVDLGTDMVPAISLAHETKEADIMARPPRNAATDRLVNRRLMTFSYLQIGVIQALAGFFTYMTVMNDYGYPPRILMGNGIQFESTQLLCRVDADGVPSSCGYGCGTPEVYSADGVTELTYADEKDDNDSSSFYTGLTDENGVILPDGWCRDGCAAPGTGEADPFVEFLSSGFRGFSTSEELLGGAASVGPGYDLTDYTANAGTCERTCDRLAAWGLAPNAASRGIFTQADLDGFSTYCGTARTATGVVTTDLTQAAQLVVSDGNAKRGIITREGDVGTGRKEALAGSAYWWNALRQRYPNTVYQNNVLVYAQTAYFICIIVVQWADLLISKTRKLSLFEQGLKNRFMNFGLVFETVLGAVLCYVSPFWALGIRPILFIHWLPGLPWSMTILMYDETRKWLMRHGKLGRWTELTYW